MNGVRFPADFRLDRLQKSHPRKAFCSGQLDVDDWLTTKALLLAQALRDCYDAGKTFPFIAVILDCIDDKSKAFYQRFDFAEMPGHPHRLYLAAAQLEAMISSSN